eukprot:XP_027304368.1 olfactory receptor 14J1-like [Anas platyrhynchos]
MDSFFKTGGSAWKMREYTMMEKAMMELMEMANDGHDGESNLLVVLWIPSNHALRHLMSNSTLPTEFLLLPFADTRKLQLLHFTLFLGIYLAALLGNGLILTAVACDHRLHTPMYFFLLNLALLDLGTITTTVPKATANSLWDTRNISYSGCVAQVFFFLFMIGGEYCLLTLMAYDRYVAICKPLHYGTIMDSRTWNLEYSWYKDTTENFSETLPGIPE